MSRPAQTHNTTVRERRCRLLGWPLAAIVALLSATSPSMGQESLKPPPSLSESKIEEADRWFKEGNALARKGKLDEAHALYQKAWAAHHSVEIAGNLGMLELAKKMPREAATHLGYAVFAYPPDGDPEMRRALRERLGYALSLVGTLRVEIDIEDVADVWIEGEPAGTSRDSALYVEPGTIAIQLRPSRHPPQDRVVSIEAGEKLTVRFTLLEPGAKAMPTSTPVPAATPAPALMEPARADTGKNKAVLVAGTGAAVMGVVLGSVLTAVANEHSDHATSVRDAIANTGNNVCLQPGAMAKCEEINSALVAQDLFSNAAVWAFAAGGVFALGTVAYGFWPTAEKADSAASVAVFPLGAGRGAGVEVKATW